MYNYTREKVACLWTSIIICPSVSEYRIHTSQVLSWTSSYRTDGCQIECWAKLCLIYPFTHHQVTWWVETLMEIITRKDANGETTAHMEGLVLVQQSPHLSTWYLSKLAYCKTSFSTAVNRLAASKSTLFYIWLCHLIFWQKFSYCVCSSDEFEQGATHRQ